MKISQVKRPRKQGSFQCGYHAGNTLNRLRFRNIGQLYIIFGIGITCLRCLIFHGITVWISIFVHMDYLRIWNSRNSEKICSKIGFIAVESTELLYFKNR